MNFNTICSCGLLVASGTKCLCQKNYKTDSQKNHPSRNRSFQKLRKKILIRDNGHCQRCMYKFDILTTSNLEVHHIKSWRDFPDLAEKPSNLIIVCRTCNTDLGNKNELDFPFKVTDYKQEFFL